MQKSTPVPDDWKTDNLFLLVGGNPLPNYIAAHILLRPKGRLHLVYSKDVKEIANKLAGYFPSRHLLHELQDPADGAEILKVLSEALQKHCQSDTVGLHYTGGTKAMSVHAHQIIRKQCNDAILTYLDARTLSLRRDDQMQPIYVQYQVKPMVADLFNLHDITLQKELPNETPQPIFPQLEKALAEVHSTKDGIVAYDRWCRRYLRIQPKKYETENRQTIDKLIALSTQNTDSDFYKLALMELRASEVCRNEKVNKASHFLENPIPLPDQQCLSKVTAAMQTTFGIDDTVFDPQTVVDSLKLQSEIQKINHLIDYLDGTWMEQWVLAAFIANQATHCLHSLTVSLESHQKQARLKFEFDVAAMQGYQLYAVSCTRSEDHHLCKSKLFEAFTRATQMGGDEARVGLVCAVADSDSLQKQVSEIWRTKRNRMRVFGTDDLPNLSERFAEWLGS